MNTNFDNGQVPKPLIAATARLLRPLVRGFIRFGLTYPLLSDLLKRAYVAAAQEDFRISPDKPPSDSRITLLTRVHRKDVKRFREEAAPPPLNLAGSSVPSQIIARWLGDKNLLDKTGQPIALRRTGEGPHSFDTLARSISKDMHPRAILDELLRAGSVRTDDHDMVRLETKAFLPRADFDNLAYYFGLNLHDHIAASSDNLAGDRTPHLERSVHYTGLSAASVKALEQQARSLGMDALVALNAHAQQLEKSDKNKKDANQRMTFGVYFYDAPDESKGGKND